MSRPKWKSSGVRGCAWGNRCLSALMFWFWYMVLLVRMCVCNKCKFLYWMVYINTHFHSTTRILRILGTKSSFREPGCRTLYKMAVISHHFHQYHWPWLRYHENRISCSVDHCWSSTAQATTYARYINIWPLADLIVRVSCQQKAALFFGDHLQDPYSLGTDLWWINLNTEYE
jgi:hypothetical protein